ncbi:MAG: zinc metalloprotease [bacterium]|nr:MAG: zinc metalloprotease [bacterium]
MIYVLSAIVVLGILIIVHEFGHFWMARMMGVGVEKFSIGFGKALWTKKIGETEYRLAWIPFGGYVKMVGDEEDEGDAGKDNAFNMKPVWRRAMIVSAGPVANMIFAALVFSLVFMIGVNMPDTRIRHVLEDSPAESAGMTAGDRILEINDRAIKTWDDLAKIISESPGEAITVKVEKADGLITQYTIVPDRKISKNIFGEEIAVGRIGISPDDIFIRYNPVKAVYLGLQKTVEFTYLTGLVIVKIFQRVVPADTIGGPLMIFKIAGDQAEAGLIPFLMFMGLLSVNLGLLNFLPIPILDGGHLAFFMVEAIMGKPVSVKGMEIAQKVGMFLIMALMAFAFYNDITRFIKGDG